jgi:hypothetical protein
LRLLGSRWLMSALPPLADIAAGLRYPLCARSRHRPINALLLSAVRHHWCQPLEEQSPQLYHCLGDRMAKTRDYFDEDWSREFKPADVDTKGAP